MEPTSLFLSPAQVTASYAQTGADKTRRSAASLLLLGILAGAIIALAGAATNTAVYGISDIWTARTVCALLFPFGLATVVLMGAELFTGNCLITISLLDRRCTLGGMLRNWVLVYAGNTVGAVLIALVCAKFGQMDYSSRRQVRPLAPQRLRAGCSVQLPGMPGGADGPVGPGQRQPDPGGLPAGVLLRPVRV